MKVSEEYIVGVDEAGRGPLAGPLVFGVSCIPKKTSTRIFKHLKKEGLFDSKQVKEKDREKIYEILKQLKKSGEINWTSTFISADIISTKGLSFAIQLAISKSLKKLSTTNNESKIILEMDGSLRIPEANWKKASVIIKGDTIKPSIMIASIIAKVERDRYMKKIASKYSHYQFEIHKGYGTLKHRETIRKHGLSKEHRVGWFKG